MIAAICTGAAAACAILYLLRFTDAPATAGKSGVKTASVALLAAAALAQGAPVALMLGLGLGAIGDFWLSRDGDRAFLLGLSAFALAHLAYVVLFFQFAELQMGAGQALAALFLVAFGAGMARVLWSRAGALRGPVMVYVLIICAMGLAALTLPLVLPIGLATLGAALFILSDTVLALQLFVLAAAHPARRFTPVAIWVTYWFAQLLFLLAFGRV